MENNLPEVHPETCFSIGHWCSQKTDREIVKSLYKKVKKKNPVLALWIKTWSEKTTDKFGSMACGLILYRLIESQFEANEMKNLL